MKILLQQENLSYKQAIGNIVLVTAVAVSIILILGSEQAQAALTRQLDLGDQGAEVTELQRHLATNVYLYPSGLITGYFGALTQAGVQKFQATYGIVSAGTPSTTGYGRVGPLTQSAINANMMGNKNIFGDVYAPTFKSINVRTDSNGASITWTANEASFGKVYYSSSPLRLDNTFDATGVFSGEPIVSGTLAQYDGSARVTHTVNINNLSSNTTYYYVIVLFDATKNVSITSPATFRTTR